MSATTGRIVILSDTHLGKPRGGAGSALALRPLWQGADRLIINGDVAEIHDATLRTEAARQVMQIEQMCEADGVELTLISGNHDPLLTDLRSVELNNGEVYLTHGDALHPAISPWTDHRDRLRFLNQRTHDALSPREAGSTEGHLAAAQYASHFTWDEMAKDHHQPLSRWQWMMQKAMQVMRVIWYWQTLPRAASRFAKQHAPDSRFFVFGHIHRTGIWRKAGRVVINTGAYGFPFRPRAVVIENGELAVWPVIGPDEEGTFHFGRKPISSFTLQRDAA